MNASNRFRAASAAGVLISIAILFCCCITRLGYDRTFDGASDDTFIISDDGGEVRRRRRLQSEESDTIPKYDPSTYSYLIIQYHKTGHALSQILTDLIKYDEDTPFNHVQRSTLPKRIHDPQTKCPINMDLLPGMIYIQAGPDFFCDVTILAEELLRQTSNGRIKKGIKIIHLVRNPFQMAVSNYQYHSQDITPEKWVRGYNVCKEEHDPVYNPELLMPTLGGAGLMSYADFSAVLDLCHSLFQTHVGLETAYYDTHLLNLEPREGLLLATTTLMRGKIGDITRMANNILKLQQLQDLEAQANLAQHHILPENESRIQVLTLAMDDFTVNPYHSAMHFLEFILRDIVSPEVKERIAIGFVRDYESKFNGHMHITTGNDNNAMLEASLREHELFGRILGNIEHVVSSAAANVVDEPQQNHLSYRERYAVIQASGTW